jgi:glucuronokinase
MIETRAYARAGLMGNPSDGYFGKTISVSVRNFSASIVLYQSPELQIEPQLQDSNIFKNIYDLRDAVSTLGYHGGTPLIKATIKKFLEYCEKENKKIPNKNFTIRYQTTIPRQVGLAGSSAIVVATLRALIKFYKIDIPKPILPTLALKVETEELGITAGLQDRVIQCYEGCVYMDFNRELVENRGYGEYKSLDIKLLPKLYIAYKTELSKVSGKVLNDIRTRWDKGEPLVVDTLQQIAQVAADGKEAILEQNFGRVGELINQNFDLRSQIMKITDNNQLLIDTARSCGASASFTGSGGSIIGIYQDDEMLNRLFTNLKAINARVIKPYFVELNME